MLKKNKTKLEAILPKDLKPLKTEAEKALLEAAEKGEFADRRKLDPKDPGHDKPENSDNWSPERNIRAKLLAWLCTDKGASELVHYKGVQVAGAKVTGVLDLEAATLLHPLTLDYCAVKEAIILRDAETRTLSLQGSHTGPVSADRMKTRGSVFLRYGFHARGEVRLLGADIEGDLDCIGGTFENENGYALNADGMKTMGDVFLRDKFHAKGEVNLLGAEIGGDLSCIDGTFENEKGVTLNAENMTVKGVFFWRTKERPAGVVDLMHANVGQLSDNKESWPEEGKLALDGFEYGALAPDDTPKSAEERLRWIGLQLPEPFKPQPYEQLAKVLRGMGHEEDARDVLIAKNDDMRKYGELSRITKLWYWFLGGTIRYGWRTRRVILGFIFPMLILGWGMFWCANDLKVMQPSKERVYMSTEFKEDGTVPPTYPVLSPLSYSIDTFVPFVNLHQENYWLPDASRPWGWLFRIYLWAHILLGWLSSTLALVSLTGLIRKE